MDDHFIGMLVCEINDGISVLIELRVDLKKNFFLSLIQLRILGSFFFRVEFRDFFIADELNSMTYSLTNFLLLTISKFLFLALFFFWTKKFIKKYELYANNLLLIHLLIFNSFIPCLSLFCDDDNDNKIENPNPQASIYFALIGVAAPWSRFLQCLRRYKDTRQSFPHFANSLKYFATIISILLSFAYRLTKNNNDYSSLKYLYIFSQTISSAYSFFWDIKMDWSLFDINSVNYLLRDELFYKYNSLYYFAILTDLFLRFDWILALMADRYYKNYFEINFLVFIISFGEILRLGE